MKRQLAAALAALLITGTAAGCGMSGSDSSGKENSGDTGTSADSSGQTDFSQTDADMFTDRDYETDYDESSSVYIELNGSTAEADSDSVQISGSTITITEEATYIISGTLDDGMIIVDAPDTAKLQLVFDGADINSETSAPLYIPEADKVFVTLAEGTENTLSNGGTYTAIDDSNIDSAIFSRQDLTLNGSGSLAVTSPAGHGIVSNDDLVITGGTYTVSCASHGLKANDSIRLTGSTTLNIRSGKDGIHSENDSDVSLGFVYISGGGFDIAFEVVGASSALSTCIDGVKAGGKVVMIGNSIEPTVAFELNRAVLHEITLIGSVSCTEKEFRETIDLIAKKTIKPERYVTDIVGLDDLQKSFERLVSPTDPALKIVVKP